MTKRRKHNYLDKAEFTDAVMAYVERAKKEMAEGKEQPVVTNYIAEGIMKICQNQAKAGNFAYYPFREEMENDAIENCLRVVLNFDGKAKTRSGKPNAFGYFSQIAYFAFLRRIAKEKRDLALKNAYLEHHDMSTFVENPEAAAEYLERMRSNHIHNDLSEKTSDSKEGIPRDKPVDSAFKDFL